MGFYFPDKAMQRCFLSFSLIHIHLVYVLNILFQQQLDCGIGSDVWKACYLV